MKFDTVPLFLSHKHDKIPRKRHFPERAILLRQAHSQNTYRITALQLYLYYLLRHLSAQYCNYMYTRNMV